MATAQELVAGIVARLNQQQTPQQASTNTATRAGARAGRTRSIRARRGDTLSSLAESNNSTVASIQQTNGISRVFPGMNVNIPRLTGAQSGDTRASSSVGNFTSNPTARERLRGGYIPDARVSSGISSPFSGMFDYNRYAGIDAARRASSGRGISDTIQQPISEPGYQRRAGEILGPEYAGLTFANSQQGLIPGGLTDEARMFAGSRFAEPNLLGRDEYGFTLQDENIDVGVQRQGILDTVNRISNDVFQNRISSLAIPTMFAEINALEEPAKMYEKLAKNYTVDKFGNLVRKGTEVSDSSGFADFGNSGYGSGGYGRRGRTTTTTTGRSTGQSINTSMTTWRIATG